MTDPGPALDVLICPACADRTDKPQTDGQQPVLVCQSCGHRYAFLRQPLFCLTGPSGTGKSTVARQLLGSMREQVMVLEQDLLWMAGLRDPAGEHAQFRTTWLRLAAMIGQNGWPVLLSGTVVPPELEHRAERPLLGDIHYIGLVCQPDVLRARLAARPAWRGWDEARIAETLEFNEWIRANAATTDPPMRLLDTTNQDLAQTAETVRAWVLGKLAAQGS